ncbi:hypothetical protein V6N12_016503 [Hibiscus sabdariffa]|uniref:Uncharacterized protein n=1 Tax=Hibiscus sabdariffa TaxID=183260 RepID=A0ABR2CFG8_9ROSI
MVDPFTNVSLPQFSNTDVPYQDEFQANADMSADVLVEEASTEVIVANDLEASSVHIDSIPVEPTSVETVPVETTLVADNAQNISEVPARHDSAVVTSR